MGLGRGLLSDGEVAISATNRNFRGRMGSRSAQAYLASPAVVAESALQGYIAGPASSDFLGRRLEDSEWRVVGLGPGEGALEAEALDVGSGGMEVAEGFPPRMDGELVFCASDNIDTDGIYAGRHCYEDLDARAQAAVAMENYDPAFAGLAKAGDVLVAGSNFGCGSSREQAATALKVCDREGMAGGTSVASQ